MEPDTEEAFLDDDDDPEVERLIYPLKGIDLPAEQEALARRLVAEQREEHARGR